MDGIHVAIIYYIFLADGETIPVFEFKENAFFSIIIAHLLIIFINLTQIQIIIMTVGYLIILAWMHTLSILHLAWPFNKLTSLCLLLLFCFLLFSSLLACPLRT
jgi:hypothetical protein